MTAPGTPIDVAYVEITARTKEFRRDIRRIIDDEVRDLGDELTDALDEIDEHFKKTAKSADDALKSIDDTLTDVASGLEDVGSVFDEIDTSLADLNASLDAEFDRSFRKFRESWEDIDKDNVGKRTLKSLRDGVNDLGSGIMSMLRGAGAGFVSFVASIPPLLLPIALALPPLIGMLVTLGAVVTDAAGAFALLPGALSVLAAIIAPLVVGFNGFGEALGAAMEKDPEKFKEALKGLTPAARFVVHEFRNLLSLFEEIGDTVQQALFTPLVGDLTELMRVVGGPLAGGMANVAFTLGEIISDITGVLASPEGVTTLAMVFETTNEILQIMRPVIKDVFGSMLVLIRASLPFLQLLTGFLGEALTKFANWIVEAERSGALDEFFSSALDSLRFIGGLLGSIIDFFGALFTPETIAGGQIILALLTDMFNQFTAFLKTPAGQRFLEDLTILAIAATGALSALLQMFAFIFASITLFVGEFIRLITGTGDILDEWKNRAEQTSKDIVEAIGSVPQRLMALGTSFLNAGGHLIESFISGFRRTGSFISDVAGDIVKGVKGGLNRLIATINAGIANIDAALPFSIGRIPALAEGAVVRARPGGTIAQIGEGGQDEAVAPLDTLMGMISDAVGSGQSIVFEPGAINVSFSGATPTEAEARAAGRAVGDGILERLALRNVRTQVRAA